MKVGVILPTVEDPHEGHAPSYCELRDLALEAEAAGFDSLWAFDHLLYQRWEGAPALGVWEPWTLLAGLAQATRRIELGTLVSCVQFRNPALLAKMAAGLDEISQGRFTLGIGAGWHEPEFNAFGVPFDHRVSRFAEAVQIIQPLLKAGRVDFSGTYYQARHCELRPRGPSASGVPLLIGGQGPRMWELTARYADAWNTGYLSELATLAVRRASLVEACTAAGRDTAAVALSVHVPIVYPDRGTAPPFLAEYLTGDEEATASRLDQFASAGVAHVMLECFPGDCKGVRRLAGALQRYR